jgi:hypothetical protein
MIPSQYTPGGDFSWIKYTTNSIGSNRGHSIIATGYSYVQDSRITTSPGGTGTGVFQADILGCTSCHDPHGKTRRLNDGSFYTPAPGTSGAQIIGSGSYGAVPGPGQAVGAYRLLGGLGYSPRESAGTVVFVYDPPHAVSPFDYNRVETGALNNPSVQTRVAYGAGMSEWCANCHGQIHLLAVYQSGTPGLRHPASNNATLNINGVMDNYNAYVSTGNMTGTLATSFNSLVPFEEQSTDYAVLLSHASTSAGAPLDGPTGNANVQCLSCHRVHATAFDSMMRYDISDTLITDTAGAWAPRNGMTDQALQAAYYGRTNTDFVPGQRVLCNKCHAQD